MEVTSVKVDLDKSKVWEDVNMAKDNDTHVKFDIPEIRQSGLNADQKIDAYKQQKDDISNIKEQIALIHMDIEKNNFPFVDNTNDEDFIPNTIDQEDIHKKNGELLSIHVDDQQTLSQLEVNPMKMMLIFRSRTRSLTLWLTTEKFERLQPLKLMNHLRRLTMQLRSW